jgi:uncharacterized protein with HEPN domain
MPSDRTESTALNDIQHYSLVAKKVVNEISYEDFLQDEIKFLAITRCLEIISEASRRLSNGTKDKAPDIKWAHIAAAGNVYRHDYEMIETNQVWDAVVKDLPVLLAFVEAELAARTP